MYLHKVREFMALSWTPEVYSASELCNLLGVSEGIAQSIILSIHGGLEGAPWVTHHELSYFLKDVLAISEVPEKLQSLTIYEQWLVGRGWVIDGMRELYRWVDPLRSDNSTCPVRFSLRGALYIESSRIRQARDLRGRQVSPSSSGSSASQEEDELAKLLGG